MAAKKPRRAAADLRPEAERRLGKEKAGPPEDITKADARALLHELQVQQIELEMQNEELRSAKAEMQDASDKYQDLFDFAPTGYFRLGEQGQILEINLAGATFLRLDRSTATGKRLGQFVAMEHRAAFAQFCQRVLATAAKQTCEIELCGNELPVCVVLEGVPEREGQGKSSLRVTATDITVRKRMEESLREGEKRFKDLAELLPQTVYEADVEGRLTFVNRESLTMFGYTRQDVEAGLNCFDTLAASELGRVRENFQRVLQGHDLGGIEYTARRKDRTEFPVVIYSTLIRREGTTVGLRGIIIDVTEQRQSESEREVTIDLLRLIGQTNHRRELLRAVTALLHKWSGCEAVGIRLREGDDFPYFETRGFSPEFVQAENKLCAVDKQGEPQRDSNGNPILECMCGNVICGRFDPAKPFFTLHGTFWSNCTSELLASTTEADRQARTRNRCHGEGYESVALIPLRAAGETFGLLQLNDRRKGRFTPQTITLLERLGNSVALGLAHRKAQKALQKSEERYRSLFNMMTEGFALHEIICDEQGEPCDYRFLDVNPGFEQLTGLNRDAVIGRTMREVMPGEHSHWIKIYGSVALTGQSARFEGHSAAIDRHYEVYAYRTAPGQFAVTFTDVTERKQNLEALREAQERLALAANAAQIGMFDWNLQTGEVVWSQQHEVIFAYAPTTAATATTKRSYRDWADRVHPDDLAAVEQRIRRCISEKTPYQVEYRILWPEGSLHWIEGQGRTYYDADGRATRMVGTVMDVTPRKAHVREVERLNRLYSALSELNQIIARVQSREELFSAACRIANEKVGFSVAWVGLPEAETRRVVPVACNGDQRGYLDEVEVYCDERAEGQGPTGTCIREDRVCVVNDFAGDLCMAPWHDAGAARGFRSAAALPIRFRGEVLAALTVYDSDPNIFQDKEVALLDEVAAAISFALDKLDQESQRKLAEERQHEAERLQAESEKLAATGRMAAQVAHEINNPLAGIKNSFRLIKAAVPEDHPDRDMAGRIEREIDRIAQIVRQMYELHHFQARTPCDLPVGEAIGDVLAMLAPLCLERQVTIESETVAPELTVWAPAGSLKQVLYNLLQNAIQATPPQGSVDICARRTDRDYVEIMVHDRGHGISAEIRDRIYEPFFSTDATDATGTRLGLGLSIVKTIVNSIGGRIEFDTAVDQGTCFRVYFPSRQRPEPQ